MWHVEHCAPFGCKHRSFMGSTVPKHIDPVSLHDLCYIHCTDQELAAFFNVGTATITRRKADSKTRYEYDGEKLTFLEIMERGKGKGRATLRRKQMELAEKGNPTMLIWLGKIILGQREVVESQVTGAGGGSFKIEIVGIDPPGASTTAAHKDVPAIETVQYLPEVGSPVSQ